MLTATSLLTAKVKKQGRMQDCRATCPALMYELLGVLASVCFASLVPLSCAHLHLPHVGRAA